MYCVVCGKKLGVLAQLSTNPNDPVCRECHEEGERRLMHLVQAVDLAPKFEPKYARRWVSNLEDLAAHYQVPPERRRGFELEFLEHELQLADKESTVTTSDMEFIEDSVGRFGGLSGLTPVLAVAVRKMFLRWTIQQWDAGERPARQCQGLLLARGETCHWEEGAKLVEQRKKRVYVGGHAGFSIPLYKGIRFNVGTFKGAPIDTTYWSDVCSGLLHITSSRICFTGPVESVAINYKKIINMSGFEDGFLVHRSTAKVPVIFKVPCPELTVQLLTLAVESHN